MREDGRRQTLVYAGDDMVGYCGDFPPHKPNDIDFINAYCDDNDITYGEYQRLEYFGKLRKNHLSKYKTRMNKEYKLQLAAWRNAHEELE
ncbi:MAG: hypothetical protein MJZ20_01645 [Bacteroidaceae bacterium]|nr:hypothetical protein [Bacteroidaceae bacterium]